MMWWKSTLDCAAMDNDGLRAVVPALKADAELLVAEVQQRAVARGQAPLPQPPEVPISCCGRGCTNCVWQYYYAAVRAWRDAAMQGW